MNSGKATNSEFCSEIADHLQCALRVDFYTDRVTGTRPRLVDGGSESGYRDSTGTIC